MRYFTGEGVWFGGYYELALELGPRSDERLVASLTAIWGQAKLDGCFLDRDREPHQQPRVRPSDGALDYGHLQGVATLPSGNHVACGTFTVREDDGPDWVGLYLPLGALGRVLPVGAFPSEEHPGQSLTWRRPLDDWLADIGRRVYRQVPFRLGLIGFEASGETYASDVSESGIPANRYFGYLWPGDGRLNYYAATG